MAKALLVLVMCVSLAGCWETGDGEKVGTIIKLSKQGGICKTWEAQMIRGGMNAGSGGFGIAPFDFTIEDERQLQAVQEAFDKQYEVRVHYKTEMAYWPCRSDSGYFLQNIRQQNN